jgi:hypothetical protein
MFRILALAGGVLVEWEELEADGLVEALSERSVGQNCERVEIWREGARVAVLGPARVKAVAPVGQTNRTNPS